MSSTTSAPSIRMPHNHQAEVGTREGRGVAASALLLALIHPSAWNWNSRKSISRKLHSPTPNTLESPAATPPLLDRPHAPCNSKPCVSKILNIGTRTLGYRPSTLRHQGRSTDHPPTGNSAVCPSAALQLSEGLRWCRWGIWVKPCSTRTRALGGFWCLCWGH
jgi:hypothetical protein